jgi:hypothetical protein
MLRETAREKAVVLQQLRSALAIIQEYEPARITQLAASAR